MSSFADLTSVVQCCESERGLLSMALAPDFSQSGLFYVDYTGKDGPGNLHVAELRANGDKAGLASLRNVLTIGHIQGRQPQRRASSSSGPTASSTSRPATAARPRKTARTTACSARSSASTLDKQGSGPYSVPSGNPFVGAAGADEIWAYGSPQPVSLLLRSRHRRPADRRRWPGQLRGGRSGAVQRAGWAVARTTAGLPARASRIPEWHPRLWARRAHRSDLRVLPRGRGLRDHRRLRGSRPEPWGPLRSLHLYSDYCVGQLRSSRRARRRLGRPLRGNHAFHPVSFGEDSCGRLYASSKGERLSLHRLRGAHLQGPHGLQERARRTR